MMKRRPRVLVCFVMAEDARCGSDSDCINEYAWAQTSSTVAL